MSHGREQAYINQWTRNRQRLLNAKLRNVHNSLNINELTQWTKILLHPITYPRPSKKLSTSYGTGRQWLSQLLAICSHPDQDETSPNSPSLFKNSPKQEQVFQASSSRFSHQGPVCTSFSCSPWVPHAPPISSSLIWSPQYKFWSSWSCILPNFLLHSPGWSTYSPLHHVLEHPRCTFLLSCDSQAWHPNKWQP